MSWNPSDFLISDFLSPSLDALDDFSGIMPFLDRERTCGLQSCCAPETTWSSVNKPKLLNEPALLNSSFWELPAHILSFGGRRCVWMGAHEAEMLPGWVLWAEVLRWIQCLRDANFSLILNLCSRCISLFLPYRHLPWLSCWKGVWYFFMKKNSVWVV